jgi:hypothetical protein
MDQHSPSLRPYPADDHDRKLLADIDQYGWHVVVIEKDDEGPGFAYSVGLGHSLGHPEFMVIGLAIDVMLAIVNTAGELVRGGKNFKHLDDSGDVLDSFNVAFRQVDKCHYHEYFGFARWYYKGDEFAVLQIVWPNSQHRYPWHAGYPAALRARQPILSKSSWPFHEGKNQACFATTRVLDGLPILLVSHDEDGDWQFLCGTTNEVEDGAVVSLGAVVGLDQTLGDLADLPEGWQARRPTIDGQWRRSKIEG